MSNSIADNFLREAVILQDPKKVGILDRIKWWDEILRKCVTYEELREVSCRVRSKTLYIFSDNSRLETIRG